jgi:hypothetical protein
MLERHVCTQSYAFHLSYEPNIDTTLITAHWLG